MTFPAGTTRRGFLELLSATGAALALSPPAQGGGQSEDDGDGYRIERRSNVMVRMRDGVHLATDIYLPVHNGEPVPDTFPVILERTPYGKTIASRSELTPTDPMPKSRAEVARYFVSRGYVVIYQDCRGRYGSEGEFVKYLSDGLDGYDTCEWIIRQPWCNGKIGTMGLSYAAHVQAALACAGAPGVAAMFLDSGGFANAYQDGIRQGGAFELKQVTWAYRAALESASNGPDTDFTIKLIDVYPPNEDYPDGFAMNITDGILRVRYRYSWDGPKLLKPGEVARITVEAFPSSNLFQRGHRIRLDISSSNFPHFDVNPNTGAPEGAGLKRRIARNTVFLDRSHASHVVLPVVPPRGAA